jgi:large subunit ribosomal protein L22
MEASAHLHFFHMAPRKITVVAALVRGMPVEAAINTLTWTKRAAALPVKKLIESATANATDKSKGAVDIDKLYVKSIHVDQGPGQRRYLPRAMGRATPINKKSSHVHVTVSDEAVKKAPKKSAAKKKPAVQNPKT